MSTKQPLLWNYEFEVHRDYLDEGCVFLALRGTVFEATPSEVRVQIPVAIWELLRRVPGADFDMLNMTNDEITEHVQSAVDERLRDRAAKNTSGESPLAALSGAHVFGAITDPREKQIVSGVAYYRAQRDRQLRIAAEVSELERETTFMGFSDPGPPLYALQVVGEEARAEAAYLQEMADRVLGAREPVVRWMTTPALELDGARPGDLLATGAGRERVRDHLARIEGGTYPQPNANL